MKPSPHFGSRISGSALVAILWLIAFLSLAIFSASHFLLSSAANNANSIALVEAETLSERGIAIASHPSVEKFDPVLRQRIDEIRGFEARISSEGSRINLNAILENAGADRIVLEELFYEWGIRRDRAIEIVDSLIDWVDVDDAETGTGAERPYYFGRDKQGQPFNRPFQDLSEVLLVKGFSEVASANPSWESAFTLLSSGPLDLNEAPAELISAVCLCGPEFARLFVVGRNGYDGEEGTEDDEPYTDLEIAFQSLGIPAELTDSIAARVTLDDPIKRLVSIGSSDGIAVETVVTVQYNGSNGNILRWASRRIE